VCIASPALPPLTQLDRSGVAFTQVRLHSHQRMLTTLVEICTATCPVNSHRSGAIPSLVRLCSKGGSPSVREYAAAVLACMAHTVDVQVCACTWGSAASLEVWLRVGHMRRCAGPLHTCARILGADAQGLCVLWCSWCKTAWLHLAPLPRLLVVLQASLRRAHAFVRCPKFVLGQPLVDKLEPSGDAAVPVTPGQHLLDCQLSAFRGSALKDHNLSLQASFPPHLGCFRCARVAWLKGKPRLKSCCASAWACVLSHWTV